MLFHLKPINGMCFEKPGIVNFLGFSSGIGWGNTTGWCLAVRPKETIRKLLGFGIAWRGVEAWLDAECLRFVLGVGETAAV